MRCVQGTKIKDNGGVSSYSLPRSQAHIDPLRLLGQVICGRYWDVVGFVGGAI